MALPNANQLIFDVHNEASAILLKSYINIQLTSMILKVTDAGKCAQISSIHPIPSIEYAYRARACCLFVFCFPFVENAKQKSDDNRNIFRERYDAMQTNTHDLLKKASRRKWACDKDNYPGRKRM